MFEASLITEDLEAEKLFSFSGIVNQKYKVLQFLKMTGDVTCSDLES